MIFGLNGNIVTLPFKDMSVKTEVKSGFATIVQKTHLSTLQVVVGNKDGSIPIGSVVYMAPDAFKSHWAKQIFLFENKEVIIVPENQVIMVITNDNK
jgi:hypothetical protein